MLTKALKQELKDREKDLEKLRETILKWEERKNKIKADIKLLYKNCSPEDRKIIDDWLSKTKDREKKVKKLKKEYFNE